MSGPGVSIVVAAIGQVTDQHSEPVHVVPAQPAQVHKQPIIHVLVQPRQLAKSLFIRL
jgi:hypothetical protein